MEGPQGLNHCESYAIERGSAYLSETAYWFCIRSTAEFVSASIFWIIYCSFINLPWGMCRGAGNGAGTEDLGCNTLTWCLRCLGVYLCLPPPPHLLPLESILCRFTSLWRGTQTASEAANKSNTPEGKGSFQEYQVTPQEFTPFQTYTDLQNYEKRHLVI